MYFTFKNDIYNTFNVTLCDINSMLRNNAAQQFSRASLLVGFDAHY